MSDHIRLRGLRVQAVVGHLAEERLAPRTLLIDLDVFADLRPPGASDSIVDAVDYDALAKKVRAAVEAASRHLIEAVAEDVAAACLSTMGVRTVIVTVHKPGAIPDCDDIAVQITR